MKVWFRKSWARITKIADQKINKPFWPEALGVLLLIPLVWALVAAIVLKWFDNNIIYADTGVYHSYAQFIWRGAIPYRDFRIEYLPGVLPFIWLAKLVSLFLVDYTASYLAITLAAVFIIFQDVIKFCTKREFLFLTLILFFLATFTLLELDIFAAAALYASVRLLKKHHYGWSAVLLGIATLIKAYPLVCLPALLLGLPRSEVWRYLRIVGLVLLIGILPFILISPAGVWQSFTYHFGRPLQIISSPAAIGFILHLFGEPLKTSVSHRSLSIEFPLAPYLNVLSSLMLLIGLVTGSIFLYVQKHHDKIATGCILLLMIFIVFFKVGSPGFLMLPIVLLPFVAGEAGSKTANRLWLSFTAVAAVIYGLMLSNILRSPNPPWFGGFLVVNRFILQIMILVLTIKIINTTKLVKKNSN